MRGGRFIDLRAASRVVSPWLAGALVLGVMAYALAEEVVFFGSYNSPRGLYDQLIATDKLLIGQAGAPDASAILELAVDPNAPRGFLPPSVSNPIAISGHTDADGLFVYNPSTGTYDFFQEQTQTWKSVGGGSFWTSPDNGVTLLNANTGKNVGIGTSTPAAMLEVRGGAVWFDGATGGTPTSGEGTRLMWIPEKAAFRAGWIADNSACGSSWNICWDDDYVGVASTGLGFETLVEGDAAFGMGVVAHARKRAAFSFGSGNDVYADFSTALGGGAMARGGSAATAVGQNVGADGAHSTAMGYGWYSGTSASGQAATAIGVASTAAGDYSLAMGHFVGTGGGAPSAIILGSNLNSGAFYTNLVPNSLMVEFENGSSTPPTLFVGPSAGVGTAGNVGIGTSAPARKLEVAGALKLADEGARPACTATTTQGTIWFDAGGIGVMDTLAVCANGPVGYAWRSMCIGGTC